MAENPHLDLAALTAEAKCFNCWSQSEKRAATVWLMAQALKAIAQNDPDHDFTNVDVFQDTISCFRCVPDGILESFIVVIFKQLAVNFGAIANLSPAQIREQASCWFCLDSKSTKAGFAFLINEIISDTSGGPEDD